MELTFHPLQHIVRLPTLDFTEDDGSDPLSINDFYHNQSPRYIESNLSKVWIVKSGKNVVAYFTVSMSTIELDKLSIDEKVRGTTPRRYPSMLIGRMGVNKKHRKKGIGLNICDFCRGLAIDVSERIACRYLTLQTTIDKIPFYEKCGFVKSGVKPTRDLHWMYSRIV